MPSIIARVPAGLLASEFLNGANVAAIEKHTLQPSQLMSDHAGHYSMNAQQLTGGVCGALPCDGLGFVVGLFETEAGAVSVGKVGGVARNNSRFSTSLVSDAIVYSTQPTPCTTDAQCSVAGIVGVANGHFCAAAVPGSSAKICVQEHLSNVAASIGMFGSYAYNTVELQNPDPSVNVPTGTSLNAAGAPNIKLRIANDYPIVHVAQLNFLVQPGGSAVPALYVNRSSSGDVTSFNWAARAYGTFITMSSGNDSNSTAVACTSLKNGLCVGMYDYQTYNDLTTHRIAATSSGGNTLLDPTLERPHLLGPGNHTATTSGLHLPKITTSVGTNNLVNSSYLNNPPTITQLRGTSFSAPAVLSAALQAHLYEGAFSALAFPMVNKAVLMASTQDANNDGAVGKSRIWSAQPGDAVDGAGQLNLARTKTILDNNQYYTANLSNASFVSCGTNCRQIVVATPTVPAGARVRVALAWQTCAINSGGNSTLINDLDLVVTRNGTIFEGCEKSVTSNTVTSELEMLEMGPCVSDKTYTIAVRIKNGATLASCSASDTFERIGVSWSIRGAGMP
ncbi:MAG: hypothetical protein KBG15_16625 [Kofleriaceae bacterium]|nr:hypothetical protein [Kofleriaceae bacterium]